MNETIDENLKLGSGDFEEAKFEYGVVESCSNANDNFISYVLSLY